MSCLNDNDFDAKLEQLLKASVSPGGAPSELSLVIIPRRPKFNWALFGGAVTVIALVGTLLVWLVLAQPAGGDAGSPAPGQDIGSLISEGISIGAHSFSSPVFLMYTAAIMGCIYIFLTRRIMRLFRLY